LVHVVDVSGTTDAEGEYIGDPGGGGGGGGGNPETSGIPETSRIPRIPEGLIDDEFVAYNDVDAR
jgi:hypothetical protein